MEVFGIVFIATNHFIDVASFLCTSELSKKLLLSEIFYGIPDSRLRIDIDGLMHLRISQLGKLVSP
jgi:hypothetical protein